MKKIIYKIKALKEKKVVQNAFWMIAERVVQMIIALFVGVVSARYLGPENYGTLNYGAALVTLFSAVAKLGLDNVIVKEYINRKDENGLLLGTTLVFRILSGLLSILCIIIYTLIFDANDSVIFVTTLLQAISLVFQSYDLIEFWFQSKLKSKNVAIAKTIAYITMSIYKVLLLVLGESVEWFAFATSFEYILILIILFIMYFRNGGTKLKFSWKVGIDLLKQSYHFILSGLLVTIYTQMDKLMIGNMLGEKQVGLYSVAVTISNMWGFIPTAIINSMRPTIYEAKKINQEIYKKRLKLLYAIIFWSSCFFALIITLFSKIIIRILYGEQYLGAENSLMLIVWSTVFAYIGSSRGIWIVCENKNKYSKKYIFWGAVINLVLNTILIKSIGINGAAIATLVAQIIVAFIAPLFYKETREFVKDSLQAIILKGI